MSSNNLFEPSRTMSPMLLMAKHSKESVENPIPKRDSVNELFEKTMQEYLDARTNMDKAQKAYVNKTKERKAKSSMGNFSENVKPQVNKSKCTEDLTFSSIVPRLSINPYVNTISDKLGHTQRVNDNARKSVDVNCTFAPSSARNIMKNQTVKDVQDAFNNETFTGKCILFSYSL